MKTVGKTEIPEKLPAGFLAKRRRIHFIGIGGSGMSGIAQISLNLGFSVSGSDLTASETTRELEKLGAV
ncbi:MAG: Mur ligase domain-containing protein, partial [Proteobacteria bacterium]|nr:Mur ligase domain-containing protein [Pseudomonadota bacterium]